MKYLDIGHNGIENLDFLYYMPDLEVLIVENDHVSDITAIGSCTNLEYLEVGETHVTDISPLANCVNLVHLNIGRLHELTDISPLYGLTKLERVYGKCDENVPPEQVEHLKELLPDCEIRFEFDPGGPIFGSWRYYPGGGMVQNLLCFFHLRLLLMMLFYSFSRQNASFPREAGKYGILKGQKAGGGSSCGTWRAFFSVLSPL